MRKIITQVVYCLSLSLKNGQLALAVKSVLFSSFLISFCCCLQAKENTHSLSKYWLYSNLFLHFFCSVWKILLLPKKKKKINKTRKFLRQWSSGQSSFCVSLMKARLGKVQTYNPSLLCCTSTLFYQPFPEMPDSFMHFKHFSFYLTSVTHSPIPTHLTRPTTSRIMYL